MSGGWTPWRSRLIAASSVALNSSSLCCAVSPSVSAREKLAMTPWLRGELLARLIAAVAAGQGHHPQHLRVLDEFAVQVVDAGQRQLQHDDLPVVEVFQAFQQRGLELVFGLGLLRAVDVDLGLDDRHQAGGQDLPADVELLVDDRLQVPRRAA